MKILYSFLFLLNPLLNPFLQKEDLREIKKDKDFSAKREEILEMIWNMEEEIMGKEN